VKLSKAKKLLGKNAGKHSDEEIMAMVGKFHKLSQLYLDKIENDGEIIEGCIGTK